MRTTAGNHNGIRQSSNAGRPPFADYSIIAKLAVTVIPPTLHPTRGGERTSVVIARTDR